MSTNMLVRSLVVLFVLDACCAFQFPFEIPFFKTKTSVVNITAETIPPKVAIVGAGMGGTSAAFWISKAKERFGIDIEVDVYERHSRVGGRRAAVHPFGDKSLPAIEIGDSAFAATDKNLWRATEEFNLTRGSAAGNDSEFCLWDGEKIIFGVDESIWGWLKFVWRYDIFTTKRKDGLVEAVVNRFSRFYSLEVPKWDNVSTMSYVWADMAAQSLSAYFHSRVFSRRYIREYVNAVTRSSEGQNAEDVHALQGMVAMAPKEVSIQGGVSQTAEQFLNHSGAKVFLNTAVDDIRPVSTSSRGWAVHSHLGTLNYKAVIIAAPFHSSGIALPPALSSSIPEQPSSQRHVTLLTTSALSPNPEHFGLSNSTRLPRRILTTSEGGQEPDFYSLSYAGLVREDEWAVKIVSKDRISDEWLASVFANQVSWVHRAELNGHPKQSPTTTFPPVKLDEGLYYVNAFEKLISKMEMEIISSRNIVDLLLNEGFGSSICGPRISGTEVQKTPLVDEDFVFGWDC